MSRVDQCELGSEQTPNNVLRRWLMYRMIQFQRETMRVVTMHIRIPSIIVPPHHIREPLFTNID